MNKENKWPVVNYASWKNKNWIETALVKGNCCLLIKGTQMFIINKDTAIESLCLIGGNGVVNATYKNDTIGVSITDKEKLLHKFKFRFGERLERSSVENCLDAVECLRRFIKVTEHASNNAVKPISQPKTKTLTEMMSELLNNDPDLFKKCELVIPQTGIEETLQQCILDPGFAGLVATVEKLLPESCEEKIVNRCSTSKYRGRAMFFKK